MSKQNKLPKRATPNPVLLLDNIYPLRCRSISLGRGIIKCVCVTSQALALSVLNRKRRGITDGNAEGTNLRLTGATRHPVVGRGRISEISIGTGTGKAKRVTFTWVGKLKTIGQHERMKLRSILRGIEAEQESARERMTAAAKTLAAAADRLSLITLTFPEARRTSPPIGGTVLARFGILEPKRGHVPDAEVGWEVATFCGDGVWLLKSGRHTRIAPITWVALP